MSCVPSHSTLKHLFPFHIFFVVLTWKWYGDSYNRRFSSGLQGDNHGYLFLIISIFELYFTEIKLPLSFKNMLMESLVEHVDTKSIGIRQHELIYMFDDDHANSYIKSTSKSRKLMIIQIVDWIFLKLQYIHFQRVFDMKNISSVQMFTPKSEIDLFYWEIFQVVIDTEGTTRFHGYYICLLLRQLQPQSVVDIKLY